MALYCQELDRCYHVPTERVDGHHELSLRSEPCRNNQAEGVDWADEFAFERIALRSQGP